MTTFVARKGRVDRHRADGNDGRQYTAETMPETARWFELAGLQVHSVSWSPQDRPDGAPARQVLLIHGLGAHTLSWAPVGQRLADALDAEVEAFDLIGFGHTRALRYAARFDSNVSLVGRLLEQIGPALLIGNSMGGTIAVAVAAREPSLVDGLVLLDPALPNPVRHRAHLPVVTRFVPLLAGPIGRAVLTARARMLGPERLVDDTLAIVLQDASAFDPALREQFVTLTAQRYSYPEAARAYCDAAQTMFWYMTRRMDRDFVALRDASVPTLLLHGEHDRLVSVAAARATARRHPHVEFKVLDGVGHAPQLEAPERVVDEVAKFVVRT